MLPDNVLPIVVGNPESVIIDVLRLFYEDLDDGSEGLVSDFSHLAPTAAVGASSQIKPGVVVKRGVVIGDNCIIAGQVGFAGSTTIGNNVMIGGQAGISGHLKIGDNVQIGGGSGVIKNIPSNSKVMGYPAKDLKNFIKDNK